MIEVALTNVPTSISFRAARTASCAESAVPVGERSILPGFIATADLNETPSGETAYLL